MGTRTAPRQYQRAAFKKADKPTDAKSLTMRHMQRQMQVAGLRSRIRSAMASHFLWRRLTVLFGAVSLGLAVHYAVVMPTELAVAVGPPESGQWRFIQTTAKSLQEARQRVRLRLVPVNDSAAAATLLDSGQVDLAVLRSDDPTSKDARSIAVLHRRAVMVVSPKAKQIATVTDMRGRRIGIMVGETDSNRALVEQILSHFGIAASDIATEEMQVPDVAAAIRSGRVDGVFLIGHPAGGPTRSVVAGLMRADQALAIHGIEPAEALALQFRDFETTELPAGVFAGSPPLPADKTVTVAITYELVASDALSERDGAVLAKALTEIRTRLRRNHPESTFGVELPPVDKTRRFLPHAGTAAFINNDVKSLLELYSEQIWLGLFTISIVGSSLSGFLGWAGFRRSRNTAAPDRELKAIARRLNDRTSAVELNEVQADLDKIILNLIADQSRLDGLEFPRHQLMEILLLNALIERRRSLLTDPSPVPA